MKDERQRQDKSKKKSKKKSPKKRLGLTLFTSPLSKHLMEFFSTLASVGGKVKVRVGVSG